MFVFQWTENFLDISLFHLIPFESAFLKYYNSDMILERIDLLIYEIKTSGYYACDKISTWNTMKWNYNSLFHFLVGLMKNSLRAYVINLWNFIPDLIRSLFGYSRVLLRYLQIPTYFVWSRFQGKRCCFSPDFDLRKCSVSFFRGDWWKYISPKFHCEQRYFN